MRDKTGFDLWADGYDECVAITEESDRYPFAGYKALLNEIYGGVMSQEAKKVLDLGFGTATLTARLYEAGIEVWGQDFSDNMMAIAKAKMPEAKLFIGDFSKELMPAIKAQKFDAITATYALHHVPDDKKPALLKELLSLLNPGGRIYIGDIAFNNRDELIKCAEEYGEDWDHAEFYFAYDEIKALFEKSTYRKISSCAGLIELWN